MLLIWGICWIPMIITESRKAGRVLQRMFWILIIPKLLLWSKHCLINHYIKYWGKAEFFRYLAKSRFHLFILLYSFCNPYDKDSYFLSFLHCIFTMLQTQDENNLWERSFTAFSGKREEAWSHGFTFFTSWSFSQRCAGIDTENSFWMFVLW